MGNTFLLIMGRVEIHAADANDDLGRAERELIGSRYREILRELTAIVSYQWKEHMERSALKGFLFHGGVGVGKTAMAKRLAYELCRSFGDNGAGGRTSATGSLARLGAGSVPAIQAAPTIQARLSRRLKGRRRRVMMSEQQG